VEEGCSAVVYTLFPRVVNERWSFLLYQVHPKLLQQVIHMAITISFQNPEADMIKAAKVAVSCTRRRWQ